MIKECTLCWEQREILEDSYFSCKECDDKVRLHGMIPTVGKYASGLRWAEKSAPIETHCKGCTCE